MMRQVVIPLYCAIFGFWVDPAAALERNVTGQKIDVTAYDYSTGAPKTGDSANITVYVAKDDGTLTALTDTSAAEVDATNAKGVYRFDLAQAETDAVKLLFTGKSATANVTVIPSLIYTTPPNFSLAAISSSGVSSSDLVGVDGAALGTHATGYLPSDLRQANGSATPVTNLVEGFDADGINVKAELSTADNRGGYNNILHVGSGQTYSTITAAVAASAAGDLIIVHAGSYTEDGLGKNDVDIWLNYGATITGAGVGDIISTSVVRTRILGHGVLIPIEYGIYTAASNNSRVTVECSRIEGSLGNTIFACSNSASHVLVNVGRIVGAPTLCDCSAGRIEVNFDSLQAEDFAVVSSTGVVVLRGNYADDVNAQSISGTGGRVYFAGNFNADFATTDGLVAPSGVTVILERGSITVPAGRPSLSGSGTFVVSDAFAYDTASATASTIVQTNGQAVRSDVIDVHAKLPSKNYLLGTDNSDGDVQMSEATGDFPGSVGSVSGDTKQTGDAFPIVNSGTYGNSAIKTAVDDKTGYRLSATGVDDIWDELLTAHTLADSAGKYIGQLFTWANNAPSYVPPDNAGIAAAQAAAESADAKATTIQNRFGSWSGSGDNTLLGAMKALMRASGAAVPTDIGGTYNPVTDSNEAIADGVASGASGFTTDERSQILAALSLDGEIGIPKELIWTVTRKDGKIGSSVPIVIDPDETQTVGCDFRRVLATGDAIQSIAAVEIVDDSDAGDDVDSPAFTDVGQAEIWMSSIVTFDLTGGTSGNVDALKVKVHTVGGHDLVANVRVRPSSE